MNQTLRLFLLVQLVGCLIGAIGCGGDDSENECVEAKQIRMDAIRAKCAEPNLLGCCYCSCELGGNLPQGCDCSRWALTSTTSVETCEGVALNQAMDCTEKPTSCSDQSKTMVGLYCSN